MTDGVSPLSIIVGGTNKIKIDAVTEVRNKYNLHAAVNGSPHSSSDANEQPVGRYEILMGVWNRALTSYKADPTDDIYIGIENGIIQLEDDEDRWFDIAICGMYVPRVRLFTYVESAMCEFPIEAVNKARLLGFDKVTVGKVMVEMGLVKNHRDPHIDLCGKHRREILVDALDELMRDICNT